jgi:itaconate CoA-transferase
MPTHGFVRAADRSLVKVRLEYFVPNYFHEVPRLSSDFMEIDCTVTTVLPMDKSGFFSFGKANDFTTTAARHCKTFIV